MSLSLYNKKRNFKKTAEPAGKEKSSRGQLRFVVQKHDASHLHYDFRLEMEGVLKSWAVPKGPSLNPAEKRLAMMVEDHPYDYRNFEGVIPAGEYGGGTVIVWDEGYYELPDGEALQGKQMETALLKALHAGRMHIVLYGHKLKGEFMLFQLKGKGDNTWLLVKKEDDFSTTDDVTADETSVKSGKTLVDVAHDNGTEVNHPEAHGQQKKRTKKAAPKKISSKKATQKKSIVAPVKKKPANNKALSTLIAQGEKAAMPTHFVPMMATLTDAAFDNDAWLYEIKWDGYRAVAYCENDEVEIISRNLNSFTKKYLPVTNALAALQLNAVLDGEIIAVTDDGAANFQMLQNWEQTNAPLQFFVFDITWVDGYDVTSLPLLKRKQILQQVIPANDPVIKFSDHLIGGGKEFFKLVLDKGLEGIMAKKADSLYHKKSRSKEWLKIKVNQRQEVVVAGYTKPRNSRQHFGSLLLGVYDGDELKYVGHTGSGFNTQSLSDIYKKLQPLVTDKIPFAIKPKTNMPATWLKPKLVAEIKFTEWTSEGVARHPIFMGMRSDKKAKDVIMERSKTTKDIVDTETLPSRSTGKKTATKKAATKKLAAKSSGKKMGAPQIDITDGTDQSITVNKHILQVTNLNKIYWPKEKFTKGDMLNYYLRISPYMLPYLKDRPQSLNRHPNGIKGPNFFQKDVAGKVPDWIETFADHSESTNSTVNYLVCKNEAALIYMANLGCIEINPWHARIQSADKPDWCLIDLDPDDGNSFDQVMDVALVVKKILDAIGADAYIKTSGSSGLHITIPLGAKYDYDQSKQLAELVVNLVHHEMPDITSIERKPVNRKGKIYLDYLQNRQTQTVAAPYSLRPKPGVPVSTPLHWTELKKGLTVTTWNAKNIFDRLQKEGDLFKGVLGKGIALDKVIKKMQSLI